MAIVSSTWIDEQDHLWVLQRPNTLSAEEKPKAAPPVLEFDAEGNFIQALGRPGGWLRLAGDGAWNLCRSKRLCLDRGKRQR